MQDFFCSLLTLRKYAQFWLMYGKNAENRMNEMIALVKNGASWEKPAPDKPSINESHPLRYQTVIKGNKKEVMLSECHG